MQFTLSDDQEALVEAVQALARRHAGIERARAVGPEGHDDELLAALRDAGFVSMAADDAAGPLVAALAVEVLTAAVGRINAGVRLLVAPALLGDDAPPRVAVADRTIGGPVRFGGFADAVLVLDCDEAFVVERPKSTPVSSQFGFPFAEVDLSGGRSLGPGSGERLRDWWRVALAVEVTGNLTAALRHTVSYLSERQQFGQHLASFQGLQHRLAEAHVTVEGVKWLGRVAAYRNAPTEEAAAAAAYAIQAVRQLGADLHQLTGAIGFTYEYDLQLWTTRLHGLRAEMGGVPAHRAALATARWSA
jgi:alkylation response protein AidB-like acyl-CoA dehydrogenase